MNVRWMDVVQAASIILLLAICLLTGGSQSPFRFAFYPLIVLLALRIDFALLLKAGFTFSILFVLLVILDRVPNRHLPGLLAETLSFFLVTMATAFATRTLAAERERAENATATFHSLSEDLKHRTMNLQMTLEALSEAHKRLQESDREKTTFLANVSHELRTPLSSIRSYSEILLTYNDIDSETRQDFIRTINSESERMTTLVNQNLDLIRIESGKMELNICQIKPAELIAGSVKVVTPMAQEKGLALELDIPSDIPAIRGDRQQLTQVLINLLNNAIKFTAEGRISVGVHLNGDLAEFFVADTGEGIFPEEQEVIFDEFFRISDGVPDRPRGSGLGLCIAKKIVAFHGGRIWVGSTPGKGSTFHFTVPVTTEEAGSVDDGFQGTAVTQGGYGPILVLYESAAIRQSLRKRLEKVGYQTLGADTPQRGQEIAAAVKPGLIVADFSERSDKVQGLETWAKEHGIEVLLATLYLSPASGDLSLAAHGFLEKPFDKYQIASLLDRFQKSRGKFSIISPEQEEARQLQVLLGAEGCSTALFLDGEEAARASGSAPPHAVIIGSFPPHRREEIVTFLKGVPQFGNSPFFLVQGGGCGRYIKTVTATVPVDKNGGEVLYPLIAAIEKAYALKWRKDTDGEGEAYGRGLAGG